LLSVRFFAKMEMRRNRVLKQMDKEISSQDQHQRFIQALPAQAGLVDALRHHFQQRCRQHESGAQRHKVAQITSSPVFLDDDGAAKAVRGRGRQSQQDAQCDWAHVRSRLQVTGYTEQKKDLWKTRSKG